MIVFKMSLSAISLILLIVLIRTIFIDIMPKTTFIIMWWAAVFKLLLPLRVSIPIEIDFGIVKDFIYGKITRAHSKSVLTEMSSLSVLPQFYIFMIWGIGAIVFALYFISVHYHWKRIYESALPLESEVIQSWRKRHKSHRNLKILQLDRTATPFTYGIVKPRIVIPKCMLECGTKQIEYILTHEYIHVRHFDVVFKAVLVICLCIHWFNPFVWILYILANRDIEMLCDAGVLKEYGIITKKSYALTIIDFFEQKSEVPVPPLGNGFCRKATEERVIAIMKTKKTTKTGIIMSVLAVLFSMFLALSTVSSSEANDSRNVSQDTNDIMELETDKSIPTVTLRKDKKSGTYNAVVSDKYGNVIYEEKNINRETDETMEYIYEKILNNLYYAYNGGSQVEYLRQRINQNTAPAGWGLME